MADKKNFTEDEKKELLNNPYTFRVTDHRIYFTLAFKQYAMAEIDKPDMTSRKVFVNAGYSTDILSPRNMRYAIKQMRKEAASAEGLKEPSLPKQPQPKKKDASKEVEELKKRVETLEQQIDFLKKTEHLRKTGQIPLPRNSS